MSITTECQQILKGPRMDFRSDVPEQYWEVVDRYRDELLSQAYSILGSQEDAEDVVQETFCEAFKGGRKMPGESIGAALKVLNKSNALDRLRSRGRARRREQRKQELPTRSFTTGGFSGIELKESMQKALQSLPENLRQVIVLRYWEHLSYKEISERLGIPIGGIGPLLSEAGIRLYSQIATTLPPAAHNPAKPKSPDRGRSS
jgi:RNA polymerase sigma-70 factor, ECF subfamily